MWVVVNWKQCFQVKWDVSTGSVFFFLFSWQGRFIEAPPCSFGLNELLTWSWPWAEPSCFNVSLLLFQCTSLYPLVFHHHQLYLESCFALICKARWWGLMQCNCSLIFLSQRLVWALRGGLGEILWRNMAFWENQGERVSLSLEADGDGGGHLRAPVSILRWREGHPGNMRWCQASCWGVHTGFAEKLRWKYLLFNIPWLFWLWYFLCMPLVLDLLYLIAPCFSSFPS